MNYPSKIQTLAVLAFIITAVSMSGCAIPQKNNLAQADGGTIEICYTNATHTQCVTESVEVYAEEKEAYYEQLEMVEVERSDDG